MTLPLFTHQCGGCKPLMDLHPAPRDHDGDGSHADADPVRARGLNIASTFRHACLVSACAVCLALALGSSVWAPVADGTRSDSATETRAAG